MYIVWCLVKSCKLHPAFIECSISELRRFGCRIFDIRRTADRIEKIRSEEGCFGCRIFDIRLYGRSNRKNPIRRRVLRMSNIRHSTIRSIECLACKFNVKWIVREADIKNRFLKNTRVRPLVKITINVSNFLTRYRTIVFFKEEKNLSGLLIYKKKKKIVSQQSHIFRVGF